MLEQIDLGWKQIDLCKEQIDLQHIQVVIDRLIDLHEHTIRPISI